METLGMEIVKAHRVVAWVKGGQTQEVTGSWTYGFRKTSVGWQVVQSNGTHIGLSYDD